MNFKTFFIFLLSYGLLKIATYDQRLTTQFKRSPRPRFITIEKKFISPLSKNEASLTKAYLFGQKESLNKKLKTLHKELHLMHLLTPSGLHFGVLFIFLLPLKLFRNKRPYKLIQLFILFLTYFLPGMYPIKRIALLRSASLLSPIKLPIKILFPLVFGIDYLFGTFSSSYLSFCLSFLFIGILIFSKTKQEKIKNLVAANLIVQFFFSSPIGLIAPFLGILISSYFPIFFFFLLLFLITQRFSLIDYLYELHLWILNFCYELCLSLPKFWISEEWVLLVILSALIKRKNLLFLLLLTPNISNLGTNKMMRIKQENLIQLEKVLYTNQGHRLLLKKKECRTKLINESWKIRCKKGPLKRPSKLFLK